MSKAGKGRATDGAQFNFRPFSIAFETIEKKNEKKTIKNILIRKKKSKRKCIFLPSYRCDFSRNVDGFHGIQTKRDDNRAQIKINHN